MRFVLQKIQHVLNGLEKATEIGIANIYPIISDRTEKQSIKQEPCSKSSSLPPNKAGSYSSRRCILFKSYLHSLIQQANNSIIITLPIAKTKKHLKAVYIKNETALLLIGPEGDFTKTEVEMAVNKNYIPVSLGNSILRVETAGVVTCVMVQMMND